MNTYGSFSSLVIFIIIHWVTFMFICELKLIFFELISNVLNSRSQFCVHIWSIFLLWFSHFWHQTHPIDHLKISQWCRLSDFLRGYDSYLVKWSQIVVRAQFVIFGVYIWVDHVPIFDSNWPFLITKDHFLITYGVRWPKKKWITSVFTKVNNSQLV